MSDTPSKPDLPANLQSLQRELAELAAHIKPRLRPQDRAAKERTLQECGVVMVIRGK